MDNAGFIRTVPVPENTLIVGEGQYYSKNCYQTRLNNNVLVVGASGAGKTRSIVKPNLLQANGSYIVSDPKGALAKEMGPYFESLGYVVHKVSFIHPENSTGYNPLAYCRTPMDIQKLSHMIVYGRTEGNSNRYDPFWDQASEVLYSAIIGYMLETDTLPEKEKNLNTVLELIRDSGRRECVSKGPRSRTENVFEAKMEQHAQVCQERGGKSWAYEKYREYNVAPDKTHDTIAICAVALLSSYDTPEYRSFLENNELDFKMIGQKPTIVFVEVSDTDRSADVLVNLFYSQLMNVLCDYADTECENNCLPVPVQFILDDFATNAKICNFENMIANIRSRGISAMLMVQSESQIQAGYGVHASTIVDNCNTYVYMGGSSPEMAEKIAVRANKTSNTILNMPLEKSWVFRRGQAPVFCDNFDLASFEREKRFESGMPRLNKHTGKTEEEIDKVISLDNYMKAEETIAFGLCDEVKDVI